MGSIAPLWNRHISMVWPVIGECLVLTLDAVVYVAELTVTIFCFSGKSNFYHDVNEPCTQLYKCFPPQLVCPWLTNAAEIRAFDIEAKSLDEFKQYVKQVSAGKCMRRGVLPACFSHHLAFSCNSSTRGATSAFWIPNFHSLTRRDSHIVPKRTLPST